MSLEKIFHTEQKVHIGSQYLRPSTSEGRKLDAPLDNESRTSGVLQTGREIIDIRAAAGNFYTVESPARLRDERAFEDQEQFPSGLWIVFRSDDVFEIGVNAKLMAHPKAVSFGPE